MGVEATEGCLWGVLLGDDFIGDGDFDDSIERDKNAACCASVKILLLSLSS